MKKRIVRFFAKLQPIVLRLMLFFTFTGTVIILVLFARGYRLNTETTNTKEIIVPTGIIACYSSPKAAKIYINGELKGATDQNIVMPPGNYHVKITKDGYSDWEKNIRVKGELVVTIDAVLFPKNPSLTPITNLGVAKAILSEKYDKIIFFSNSEDDNQNGIYILNITQNTLGLKNEPKLIMPSSLLGRSLNFASASATFSLDSEQVIIDAPLKDSPEATASYVMQTSAQDESPIDISMSRETLIEAWRIQTYEKAQKDLNFFPRRLRQIASESARIIAISPDEKKILYEATASAKIPQVILPALIGTNQTPETREISPGRVFVYDKKEDRNYLLPFNTDENHIATKLLWHPNSKNLIYMEDRKFVVYDYDGMNKNPLYSGPFDPNFFAMSNDGRLVILTNFNPEQSTTGDLYAVGIE